MSRVLINFLVLCYVAIMVTGKNRSKNQITPPHCTHLSKDTDYVSRFKYDYPAAYIIPGQMEAYQQLLCINPAAVNKAVTSVCDWAAPPQVQFTLGDEYVHIVRQDPTSKFLGNAIINTYQLCQHDMLHNLTDSLAINDDIVIQNLPRVTQS